MVHNENKLIAEAYAQVTEFAHPTSPEETWEPSDVIPLELPDRQRPLDMADDENGYYVTGEVDYSEEDDSDFDREYGYGPLTHTNIIGVEVHSVDYINNRGDAVDITQELSDAEIEIAKTVLIETFQNQDRQYDPVVEVEGNITDQAPAVDDNPYDTNLMVGMHKNMDRKEFQDKIFDNLVVWFSKHSGGDMKYGRRVALNHLQHRDANEDIWATAYWCYRQKFGRSPDDKQDEHANAQEALKRLEQFLEKERADYLKVVGSSLPPPDPYALNISNNTLIQRYVSTRMYYYGGGEDKEQAAAMWAKEAMSNPTPLD